MAKTKKEIARQNREDKVIKAFYARELKMISLQKLKIMGDDGIDHNCNIAEMQEEILDNTLLSPISVVGPYEDGTYYVIDGARRVNSLDFVGTHKIPCYVVGSNNITHKEAAALALSANKVKRNDDISLKVKYTQLIYDEYANGVIERHAVTSTVQRALNISSRQARKYVSIVENGSEKVQNALANGEISVNDAETIVAHHPDAKTQDKWVAKVKDTEWGDKGFTLEKVKGDIPANAVKAGVLAEIRGEDKEKAIYQSLNDQLNDVVDKTIDLLQTFAEMDKRTLKKATNAVELRKLAETLVKKLS